MRPPFVPFLAGRPGCAGVGSVALLAAAIGAPSPSDAGDQRITGSISQTFLADSNLEIDDGAGSDDDGETALGSISRLNLDYFNVTPSAQLTLSTGLSYSAFTADEGSNLEGLFPSLNGGYTVRRSTRTLGFSFSGSVRPVEYGELGLLLIPGDIGDPDDPDDDEGPSLELENREDESLRINLSGGLSYTEQVSSIESLSLGATLAHQSFTETTTDLRPSTQASTRLSWNRELTAKASAGVGSFASVIASGESAEQMTYTAAVTPSFTYLQTPDIRFSASLGPSVSYVSGTLPGQSEEEGFSVGLRGSAGFSYTGDISTTSLSLTQAVVPNDEGVSVNETSLTAAFRGRVTATSSVNGSLSARYRSPLSEGTGDGFETSYGYFARTGFSQRINARSSADVGLSAAFSDDGEESETILGANTGYSYRLTEEVDASLSYAFRIDADDDAEDPSHRLSLTLSRGFTLLP